jgi:hypothetical protein
VSRNNLRDNLLAKLALAPALRTTSANGVTIDRAEDNSYFQSVLFVIQSGAITDGTHTVSFEDSDDGSTWAATTVLQGTPPAIGSSNDNVQYAIEYTGLKRYVRVVVTTTGTTTGGIVGATAILGNPRSAAVTQDV